MYSYVPNECIYSPLLMYVLIYFDSLAECLLGNMFFRMIKQTYLIWKVWIQFVMTHYFHMRYIYVIKAAM